MNHHHHRLNTLTIEPVEDLPPEPKSSPWLAVLLAAFYAFLIIGLAVAVTKGGHPHRPSPLPPVEKVEKAPERVNAPVVAQDPAPVAPETAPVASEPPAVASATASTPDEKINTPTPTQDSAPVQAPAEITPPTNDSKALPSDSGVKEITHHHSRHRVVSYQHDPAPEPDQVEDNIVVRFFKAAAHQAGLI